MAVERAANPRAVPVQNVFEHRHQEAHRVVAEHGALGDARDHLRFGHGDGESVRVVDVHHHGQVRAAVAHVDDVIGADAELFAQLFEHGDFPVARRSAHDGVDFAGRLVVTETRAVDVVQRNDSFERRFGDLLRRGGDHVKVEFEVLIERVERAREQLHVVFQAHFFAGLDQVFASDTAKIRVVQDQIRQLRTLMHQVNARKSGNLFAKGRSAEQFAQQKAGVVEAQRLVEVAR